MLPYIEEIFIRDLNTLKNEISSFKNTENLWKTTGQITNPAGVLSQHLCGNLKHFIGATLGNSGYQRNRDLEFSQHHISREELIKNVEETIEVVKNTMQKLESNQLEQTYPLPFLGKQVKTVQLILILQSHLSYHLGQINYLRRILE